MLFAVIAKWLDKKDKSKFDRGHAWATNVLHAKGMEAGMAEIEPFLESAEDFGDYNDFDRGARKAIEDYIFLLRGRL